MTQEQIIKEIAKLPPKDQRKLYSEFSKAIRHGDENFEGDKFRRELSREDRHAIALSLSGTFRSEGRYTPMTKEEDREVIMEYLQEKYG